VQDIRDGVQQVRDDATGIKAVLERMERERSHRNTTTQTVRVEGMGSLWNGIAIGIALGAVVVGAAWIATSQASMADEQRQQAAFIAATYQAVPALRAEFDRIQAEQAAEQE
jgi:hypothetical protein